MNFFAVLKMKHHLSGDSATAISRYRSVEIKPAMRAVHAGKRRSNRAVERFGTFGAKRRYNSVQPRFTNRAQIIVRPDWERADGARWRINQRRKSANEIRRCEHFVESTRPSQSTTSSRQRRAG